MSGSRWSRAVSALFVLLVASGLRAESTLDISPKLLDAVACQAGLDRAGFSPGIIDGIIGPKTLAGLAAFQHARGLPETDEFDETTRHLLGIGTEPALESYTLTPEDVLRVGACPEDWNEKSEASYLGFESTETVAAFYGHCTRRLLARLNPDRELTKLKAGDAIVIPNVVPTGKPPRIRRLEIDFATKRIMAFDRSDKLAALFHCSIAKNEEDRPHGVCRIANVTLNPKYTFKPESWPEVKNVDRTLLIPPGPRNPVGLCWIGLTRKGYGIHGTPQPELIGKTGSHGCFRLTNWDALRLGDMLRVGAQVKFIDSLAVVEEEESV